ncbi:MAG TPA: hypothetical protein VMF86_11895, partial [Stellaceae bacterium]|nr:hypothetical protein [Stellaceae bacterium]
ANRGQPVARLVPVAERSAEAATRGTGHAILDWLAAHPLPDYVRRSAEEIDASIDDERRSWD